MLAMIELMFIENKTFIDAVRRGIKPAFAFEASVFL